MGLLRMLLAFSVLTGHMQGKSILGFRLLYANLAVECFFMISGFYMALVLNEKYNRRGDYIPFIWQRILRLFPAYLGVLLLMLVVEGLVSRSSGKPLGSYRVWFDYAHTFSWSTWINLACSNLFLLGQQINFYQALDPQTGNLYFTERFFDQPLSGSAFLFVAQAWTLSLEIAFYLLAPILVRSSAWIQILIVLASVALRQTTSWMLNPSEHPWHMNHFFPYELAFFMAGSVGYQIYRHHRSLLERLDGFTFWFRWIFFAFVLFYSRLPGNSYAREAIFVPLLFVMIPILFHYSKDSRTDRLIGELSYPFYLVHELILFLMRPWLPEYVPPFFVGPLYGAVTVGSAYLIYRGIDKRVDDYRHHLFEQQRRLKSAEATAPA
jgi:peptidoglycan/LPS O-acetylase OafA/YrhL